MGAQIGLLADGRRLHLNEGPIDLIVEAFGEAGEVRAAYAQAAAAFEGMLAGLVGELPLLRRPVGPKTPEGPVARRMMAAVRPFAEHFITPMAAVAGAVADAVLEGMVAGRRLERAYVNDGGDIAFHLAPGSHFAAGLVAEVASAAVMGTLAIEAAMPVRGLATSGWRGRSLSLGIADAATVLAASAAAADAAATLIANAVDLEDAAIERVPAVALDPDSDLGSRLVTVAVGALSEAAIGRALSAGEARARRMREAGLIHGAVLILDRRVRVVGPCVPRLEAPGGTVPGEPNCR